MENLFKDLRFGVRLAFKSPIFSLVAILSLALGIGANTTIFTLVNAVFLNPLPVEEPSRLMSVFTTDERNTGGAAFGGNLPVSHPNYEDYRDRNDAFSGLAAFTFTNMSLVDGRGEPEMLTAQVATHNLFDVLGVEPHKGRFFLPEEDQAPGSHPVAVLSYGLWTRRFAGDESIVGSSIKLNRQPYTVIGIAPQGFNGTFMLGSIDLWVPTMMYPNAFNELMASMFEMRRALVFFVVGRLKDGVSREQAEANIQSIAEGLRETYPVPNKGRSAAVRPLTENTMPANFRDMMVQAGFVLTVVVGLILLIACANVANLLLSRAASRKREIAVRLGLGASRGRLVRQLLTESVLLAVAGGAAGLAAAHWGRQLLWASRPPMLENSPIDLSFDTRVLAFTLGLSVLTGLAFGLLPALQSTRAELVPALKEESNPAGQAGGSLNIRDMLVAGQVGLSLVSLVGAGLFLRSLAEAQQIDPGFEAKHLMTLNVNLSTQGYNREQGLEFYRQALERLESLPGAASAAASSGPPLTPAFMRTVFLEGEDTQGDANGRLVQVNTVSQGYFSTLGIPLARGRNFSEADREDTPKVAIVNETMARRFWPDQNAVGQRFTFFGSEDRIEVVGIAEDAKYNSLGEEPMPYIYQPLRQNYSDTVTIAVRTRSDPQALLPVAQREMRQLDPDLALTNVNTIGALIDQSLWAPKLGAGLLSVFGIVALALAAVGIYGVMGYAVSQRRHEIGLRMALGASRFDILRLVVVRGMAIAGAGVAVGMAAALVLSPQMSSLLWISARDPLTYALTVLILTAVALFANVFPARRASAVSPMLVLRGTAQKG